MGIKLEYIIIFTIILIVTVTTTTKLANKSSNSHFNTKELEFKDTTFIEVDTKKMYARSHCDHGVRVAGVLYLTHLNYHTNNIDLLLANKGTYKKNRLFLDGNISLQEKEGFLYKAEHANYNKTTEILHITSAFTAYMNKNIIHGEDLKYNAKKKEISATGIDALVYTVEK